MTEEKYNKISELHNRIEKLDDIIEAIKDRNCDLLVSGQVYLSGYNTTLKVDDEIKRMFVAMLGEARFELREEFEKL